MFRSIIKSTLILFLLAVHSLSYAGERLVLQVNQPNIEEQITIFLQGEWARLVSTGNTNKAVLFNAATKQLRVIDHQSKTVTNIDQVTIEQLASVAEGVGDIARSQGSVLGDLFKTFGLDNAMGEKAVIEQQAVAGNYQYSGLSCQMWQVSKNGQTVTQYCITEKLGLAPTERQTLASLISFGQLLVNKGQVVLDTFNLSVPQLPNEAIKGVPIYIKHIPEHTVATLVGLKQLELSAGQFSVPAGYSESVFGL